MPRRRSGAGSVSFNVAKQLWVAAVSLPNGKRRFLYAKTRERAHARLIDALADAPTIAPEPIPLTDRFWTKVEKTDTCWLWRGATKGAGYGTIRGTGRTKQGAHRVAWELANGPIPDGLSVCHACDVPRCVRPSHLFLGTAADNARDMRSKAAHIESLEREIAALRTALAASKTRLADQS